MLNCIPMQKSGEMLTVVPGRLEDAHTFCDCSPSISFIVRRVNGGQKRNVDAEGFVRSSPSLANGLSQRFGIGLGQRRKDTCNGMFTSKYASELRPGLCAKSNNIPRPPAFETAAASEGSPTLKQHVHTDFSLARTGLPSTHHCIPPCTIGLISFACECRFPVRKYMTLAHGCSTISLQVSRASFLGSEDLENSRVGL